MPPPHFEALDRSDHAVEHALIDAGADVMGRFRLPATRAALRDSETSTRLSRVGQIRGAVGWRLTGGERFARQVCAGAPFHDVDNPCVPAPILIKPARLTPNDTPTMRCQPECGARLLEGSKSPSLETISRSAVPVAAVIDSMNERSGSHIDPDLVAIVISNLPAPKAMTLTVNLHGRLSSRTGAGAAASSSIDLLEPPVR